MSGPTTAWAELDDLSEAIARLLAVPIALVSLFDDGWQRLRGAYGAPAELATSRATRDVNPLCLRVVETGKPVIVHDARRRNAPGDAALAMFGVVAYAGFPLLGDDGAVIGVVSAIDRQVHSWTPRDITTLRTFAIAAGALVARRAGEPRRAELEAALADRALLLRIAGVLGSANPSADALAALSEHLAGPIEPARAAEVSAAVHALLAVTVARDRDTRRTAELEALSIHDDLTGLLNRRGFLAVAEGQLALARRQAMPGVVLFLDVDGLKRTNDRAGHAAGDVLLRDAARALRATFRDADTVGRMGGDEFVVFSVANGAPDLPGIAARLAAEVQAINRVRDDDAPLAWSIGFLTFDESDRATLTSMLAEADRRMYVAKQRGRTATDGQSG